MKVNAGPSSLMRTVAAMAAIAGLDYAHQRREWRKRLRMTKEEVIRELKESEGDPLIKGRLRRDRESRLRRRMLVAVKDATVLIMNPTHFAVALRYDQGRDQIPVVVAKGRGEIALAIRELASELAVPCLEYPTLARAVYYTSREGQEIRDDLYMAIATVLAFVFGVNVAAGGRQPDILVPAGARFDENGLPTPEKP